MAVRLKLFSLVVIFILTASLSSFPQDKNIVEAKVNKTIVKIGENFIYSARIEGDFISAKLVLPKFEGFIIVAQKQSQNYIASGLKTKLVVSLVYELIAPKPGIFTIKEITVKDKNNEFKSRPISIEVTGKPMQDKRKIQPYISNATDI
ncbi:MAG: BatD family protein [Candidatus Omnitrophota bacterium]|nr:BatD family protein [Candidatus Omnitrophota bacterium]